MDVRYRGWTITAVASAATFAAARQRGRTAASVGTLMAGLLSLLVATVGLACTEIAAQVLGGRFGGPPRRVAPPAAHISVLNVR